MRKRKFSGDMAHIESQILRAARQRPTEAVKKLTDICWFLLGAVTALREDKGKERNA